ncbi:MAG: hypothetical protein RI953_659 [Pseudomonadota bacterium]|jgi:hypothetical protein
MVRFTKKSQFLLAAGLFGFAACSGKFVSDSGVATPATAEAKKAHEDAMNKSVLSNQSVSETRNLTGEKFRVKDSELLRGTLACVDANLVIPADAILPGNPTAGKMRFVLANSLPANTNIIEAKKADLFDPNAEGRETASAPEPSVVYLNAATLVAEVVAHNADVTTPTSKAYCATPEAAKALMLRCVPTLTATQLSTQFEGKTMPEKMAEACAAGATQAEKDLNSRVALASFLGSWLFLKSER